MESQNKYLSDEPVPMMLDWRIINDGRKYKIQANDSSGQYRVEINRSLKRMDRDRLYNHNVTRVVVSASDPDLPSLGYKPKIALTIISSGKYAKKIVPNKAEEYLNGHWLALLAERIVEVVSCINSNEYGYNELIIEFSHGMYTKLDKKFTAAIDALRFTKEIAPRIHLGRVGVTSALLSMLKLSTTYPNADSLIQETKEAGLAELTSAGVQKSSNNDYIFFSPESVFWSLIVDPKNDITKQCYKGAFYFSQRKKVKPSTISFLREVLKKHPKTIDLLKDLSKNLLFSRSKYSFITKLPVDIIDNKSLKRSVSRFVNRDTKYLTNMNKTSYIEIRELKSVCLLVTLQALCYQFKISDPTIKKHEDKASEILAPLMKLKPAEQDVLRLIRCLSMVLAVTEALDNYLGTSMFDQVIQGFRRAISKNIALIKKEFGNYFKNANLSVEVNQHLFVVMADIASTLVVSFCESAGISAPSTSRNTTEDLDDFRDLKNLYNDLAPVIPVIQIVMKI